MLSLAVSLIIGGFNAAVRAQETQEKAKVSDKELKAFAKAYVEVDKIRSAYEPSLQNVQDPDQLKNIEKEAAATMVKAVEEQGLSREAYVKIFNTVKNDVELRGKTLKLIEEEREKS